ncbi:MAG TPA: metalloregulator ArsR/SmtB family transcription factor [Symbiobacteriaceae bacterium]|nr:metalloregulator ArsR/SmtB family transcription factor [Symbiobacteriaceae bacterium]
MGQEEMQTLLRFFKALADESRLKILGLLAQREISVEELAALLELKEPTVSHHLNKLKELGLVTMRADGNTHLYSLDAAALRAMNRHVLTPETMASLVEDVEGEAWEQKVLRDFMVNGKLKEIPARPKKRLVVLKWLVRRFATGRQYTEAEVNETIKQYHPDFATLRREFIMNRLMSRENNTYWRIDE